MQLLAMTVAASDRRKISSVALALQVVAEWEDALVIPAGCELLFEIENLEVAVLVKSRIAQLERFDYFEKLVRKAEKLKTL